MFTAWHHLTRTGSFVLLALAAGGLLAPGNSWLHAAGYAAIAVLFLLGITGAILGLLLMFTRYTFACPQCGKKDTEFGADRRDGMWLACDDCGITRAVLKLSLVREPPGDEPDADDEESHESLP